MRTITKEMQAALTPKKAIDLLRRGNKRFVNNLRVNRNLLQQVNETSDGQYPFAFILSCIDSRTSAELIFDQGLGDIMSCRIAGNILNDDILGSMEFACKIAGSKVVMVLGHTKCGAVKGACGGVRMGHLTGLLEKMVPIVELEKQAHAEVISDDSAFVEGVAKRNVAFVMNQITDRSLIIKDMVRTNEIALIGGIYDVDSGIVSFHDSPAEILTASTLNGNT